MLPLDADTLNNLRDVDWEGSTGWHKLAEESGDALLIALRGLPREQWMAELNVKNHFGNTVLQEMFRDDVVLMEVMDNLLDEQVLELLQSQNNAGGTLLHLYATAPDVLDFFLKQYPSDDMRVEALRQRESQGAIDEEGHTVLDSAGGRDASLCVALGSVSTRFHFQLLSESMSYFNAMSCLEPMKSVLFYEVLQFKGQLSKSLKFNEDNSIRLQALSRDEKQIFNQNKFDLEGFEQQLRNATCCQELRKIAENMQRYTEGKPLNGPCIERRMTTHSF